ncbi:uncharacterized protein C8Q71DRAFT_863060 [Rhodofomes roseus]|uniref:Zn(2)-C6 fungal-type domain-containing protein n=1 Tax=Rhodofomes roseus TaxID=34475 RepID=A0ABQ8JZY8_9APHY|nr:uncharacterized protein C8Q71DRAFT_863060 [Rhodofomes roseus]KAH9829682.1 hypothetical protein C8Q71DRAFT_863060 [Rhodofomes roseus]
MSSESPEAGPSNLAVKQRRAPRGSACLGCKRRKHKCDGGRPVCGPCIRSHRETECEYLDGPRPSRKQVLEDQIARLQERVQQLEEAGGGSSPGAPGDSPVPSPASPSSEGSVPRSQPQRDTRMAELSNAFVRRSSGNQGTPPQTVPDPSPGVVRMIVNAFLAHADQVAFFLHRARFLTMIQMAMQSPSTPSALLAPALTNAVYLWGVRFANTEAMLVYEPVFLSRAVQALKHPLANMSASTIIHTIQANVLLANYHFAMGRMLEGQHHCNAAVALALSCRLYNIRTMQAPQRSGSFHAMDFDLPPPNDAIEEGECIRAFWHVYMLDQMWSFACKTPSRFDAPTGPLVDTPWPMEADDYANGRFPPHIMGSRTVDEFLRGNPQNDRGGASRAALYAKAATLVGRSTVLSMQWSSTAADPEQFAAEFVNLDNLTDRFIHSLAPVETAPDQQTASKLLLVHTLACVASIQLHKSFREGDIPIANKDYAAALNVTAALDAINPAQVSFVNPILAILWTSVSRILIAEMVRLRSLWASTSVQVAHNDLQIVEGEHSRVVAALATITALMSALSPGCPLMAAQASKIEQMVAQAG